MEIAFENVMETLVFNKLHNMLHILDCCHCEKCQKDIAAYTLNSLPSKYVVTHQGELYSRAEALKLQYETDITTALLRSAKIVKDHPRH